MARNGRYVEAELVKLMKYDQKQTRLGFNRGDGRDLVIVATII